MAEKKVYRHGDRASIYLAQSTPVEILDWINRQEDLTHAILKAIAFSIQHKRKTTPTKKIEPKSLESFLDTDATPVVPTEAVVHHIQAPDPNDIEKEENEPSFQPWAGLDDVDDDDLM